MDKPIVLYHASQNRDITEFEPRNRKVRDPNEGPKVFATPSKSLATIFMIPTDSRWVTSGLHNHVPYIVISDEKSFRQLDHGGTIYHLPPETFEVDLTKGLREYEWTSSETVKPIEKEEYKSGFEAMLDSGVQVFMVNAETFDQIKNSTDHGFTILKEIESENKKLNRNYKSF